MPERFFFVIADSAATRIQNSGGRLIVFPIIFSSGGKTPP